MGRAHRFETWELDGIGIKMCKVVRAVVLHKTWGTPQSIVKRLFAFHCLDPGSVGPLTTLVQVALYRRSRHHP